MTAPADRPADQAYYWADDWQASEAEAEADLRAGRSRTFPDMGTAITYLTAGGAMTTTTPALHTLIHWGFTDPHGRPCDKPVHSDAIMLEVLHQASVADADPDFVALTIAFCQLRPPVPYAVRIRRIAYSEDTLTFLGYRQADGSYSREGE